MSIPKVLMERMPSYEKGTFRIYKNKNEMKLSIGLPIPYDEFSEAELYRKLLEVLRNYLAHELTPDKAFVELFNIHDRLQLKYNDKNLDEYLNVIYEINEPEEYKTMTRKDVINFANFVKHRLINFQQSRDYMKKI